MYSLLILIKKLNILNYIFIFIKINNFNNLINDLIYNN